MRPLLGSVTGGRLTIFAIAPNTAGLVILRGHFVDEAVHQMGLLLAVLPPTIIAALAFRLLRTIITIDDRSDMHTTPWIKRWYTCMSGLALLVACSQILAADPIIAAAADLKFALEEVAQGFQKDTGLALKLTFGSSGTFAMQIRNGAPYQVYLSADEDYVLKLHAEGLTRDQGTLYAIGRIALIAPPSSTLAVDPELQGLAAQLKAGQIKRFTIANPEHAPYGRRAEEALRHAGLWEVIKPKLIFGENVSQAAQFATSGSADGGIIALSLAKSPQMAQLGRYAVIPTGWHKPLHQRMVLLKSADATAEAFYRYMQEPAARAVMRRFGFVLPSEAN